jgi:hypothetical protein
MNLAALGNGDLIQPLPRVGFHLPGGQI